MIQKTPELLAPAGSQEALEAAIEAGADAIYFGGNLFSCRMRAKNFSNEQLADAIRLCHEYRVRTFITVNAKLYDNEINEVLSFVSFLWKNGADALIVSDIGLASLIHHFFPSFELHASTQFSSASSLDAAYLQKIGFSRLVSPREFSKKQLQLLCNASPVEIEMFIHGAHCVSFSGQCMMSYALGGRSGNRGECAQPCRLPYTVVGHHNNGKYPLSLKDMSLANHVTDILSLGVASLKIEGRQKNADYVYRVVSIWRRLLDERRNATKDEMTELDRAFSRQGFTDGYFASDYHKMGGVRKDFVSAEVKPVFQGLQRKIPLQLHFEAQPNIPITLSVTDGIRSYTASGPIPERAEKHPLDDSAARENLTKLGGTAFSATSFSSVIADNLWITKATLNQLRRDAIDGLVGYKRDSISLPELKPESHLALTNNSQKRVGYFQSKQQIPGSAYLYFDEIRLPIDHWEPSITPVLPPVMTDGMIPELRDQLARIPKGTSVVVHNFGQLLLVKEYDLLPIASFRFTIFNHYSAQEIIAAGAKIVELSPELSSSMVRSFPAPKGFFVYGRMPLMLTMRCAISSGGDSCSLHGCGGFCEGKGCSSCQDQLLDRTNASFPMIADHCQTIIFNSVPTYMGDKKDDIARLRLQEESYLFTTETKNEVELVIEKYKKGLPFGGQIRRIR